MSKTKILISKLGKFELWDYKGKYTHWWEEIFTNCVCGENIKERCPIYNIEDGHREILGNCCIKHFYPKEYIQEANKKKCEQCNKSHTNKKYNLCNDCGKCIHKKYANDCVICIEHKKYQELINQEFECRKCLKIVKYLNYNSQKNKCIECVEKKKAKKERKRLAILQAQQEEEERLRLELQNKVINCKLCNEEYNYQEYDINTEICNHCYYCTNTFHKHISKTPKYKCKNCLEYKIKKNENSYTYNYFGIHLVSGINNFGLYIHYGIYQGRGIWCYKSKPGIFKEIFDNKLYDNTGKIDLKLIIDKLFKIV